PRAGTLGMLGLRPGTADPRWRPAGRALRPRGAPLDLGGADQPSAIGALQACVHRNPGGLSGGARILPAWVGPSGGPAGADAPRGGPDRQAARSRDRAPAPAGGGGPHHRGRRPLAPPRAAGWLWLRGAAGLLVPSPRLSARADPRVHRPVAGP